MQRAVFENEWAIEQTESFQMVWFPFVKATGLEHVMKIVYQREVKG